jgi:CheY-like chemotaxis protein
MDGPTTLAALQADPPTSAIPFIFVTAHAMRSEFDGLRAVGARGVPAKPFDALGLPGLVRQDLGC